ncbi:MAG: FUN14 domain-containing protein [Phycisphaerae bacterium]
MSGHDQPASSPRPMPRWIKLALWGSALCMIAGAAMALTSAPPPPPADGVAAAGLAARAATEQQGPASPAGVKAIWDSSLFRLGLSFIAAFLAGWIVRPWIKTAGLIVGGAFALLYGLHATGLVDVHWTELQERYGGASGWLAAQTQSLGALLTGALPSAGAASAGLTAGLRRRV